MRMKSWQLRVLLMKETITTFEEALRDEMGAVSHQVVDDLPFEAAFFTRRSDVRPPKWLGFIEPAREVKPEGLLNGTTGGVLLLRAAGRRFAVTFGYGCSLIDSDAFVIGAVG
jgi:uncharacterized protein (TIGR04141 family)